MHEIMDVTDVAFPKLGIYIENLPKTFSVFGFQIAYYGVIIGIGILLGVLVAAHEAKVTGQDPDIYWDFSLYAIIASIIGARIYYVAFSWDTYKNDLLSIFNIRGGGLAIYGAVIAAFLTVAIYSKIKKLSVFLMSDTAVIGLVVGQVIGRFGNFMNREVFGTYSDQFLAMRLPIDAVRAQDITPQLAAHIVSGTNYIQVHPTFLYESMWNLFLLGILIFVRKHKKFDGELLVLYLCGYGIGRFWIEGIRTDQLMIAGTNLAVSQVLSAILVVISIVLFVVLMKKEKRKEIIVKEENIEKNMEETKKESSI